jgi:hypothetical protein
MRRHANVVSTVVPRRRLWQNIRIGLVLWVACSLLACDALLGELISQAQAQTRTRTGIATETIDIWRQRRTDSEVLLTVSAGARLTVTDRARKGFYPVSFAGVDGWALTGTIAIEVSRRDERTRNTADRDGETTLRGFATESLNLRAGPSTSNQIRTVIAPGANLELTGVERDGFVAVRHGNQTGWVAKEYVADQSETREARTTSSREPVNPVLRGDPRKMPPDDIIPFIYAAADYYGQPREDMLRVAMCESDLVPMAVNEEGGSYGIFQFKTGTWLSTPYAEYDIFDPRASAYAAAWMWSVGRRNEWVCQ